MNKRLFKHTVFLASLLISYTAYAQTCSTPVDNRKEITQITSPYTFVCKVWVKRIGSPWGETASLVSPNVLVSAGHSFYEKKSKIKWIKVEVGQIQENGQIKVVKEMQFSRKDITIWVHPAFLKNGDPDYDYSFVALNQNISAQFFELGLFDTIKPDDNKIYLSGYPGDKGGEQLWVSSANKSDIQTSENKAVLLYSMYTVKGDSGAPLWARIGNKYILMAIHGTGHYHGGACNAAVKYSASIIQNLQKFILNHTQ